jgi:hypothetical protein
LISATVSAVALSSPSCAWMLTTYLDDADLAQAQRRHSPTIFAHVNRLNCLGPDRRAAPKVDAEVQPDNQPEHNRRRHQHQRRAHRHIAEAEEIEVRFLRNQS